MRSSLVVFATVISLSCAHSGVFAATSANVTDGDRSRIPEKEKIIAANPETLHSQIGTDFGKNDDEFLLRIAVDSTQIATAESANAEDGAAHANDETVEAASAAHTAQLKLNESKAALHNALIAARNYDFMQALFSIKSTVSAASGAIRAAQRADNASKNALNYLHATQKAHDEVETAQKKLKRTIENWRNLKRKDHKETDSNSLSKESVNTTESETEKKREKEVNEESDQVTDSNTQVRVHEQFVFIEGKTDIKLFGTESQTTQTEITPTITVTADDQSARNRQTLEMTSLESGATQSSKTAVRNTKNNTGSHDLHFITLMKKATDHAFLKYMALLLGNAHDSANLNALAELQVTADKALHLSLKSVLSATVAATNAQKSAEAAQKADFEAHAVAEMAHAVGKRLPKAYKEWKGDNTLVATAWMCASLLCLYLFALADV